MITRTQYLMGRDVRYPGSVTAEVDANQEILRERVNQVLEWAAADGVEPGVDEKTGNAVASGLRPRELNDRTQNSATDSSHITGEGVDLQDTLPGRPLARWCLREARPGGRLEQVGLYMERPQWTPDWVHLQSRPPKSGRRVYIPSSKPPLVAALEEELEFVT